MRANLLFLMIIVSMSVEVTGAQDFERLFRAEDFTKMNLFSNNIEGPALDRDGTLYVVNFEVDGTVGLVKTDGSAERFLTLPPGSVANAIQFDSRNNMYLADFTGHNVLKVDMKSKKISVYSHRDDFNQPNDLCINKNDQMFASDPNWSDGTGKLWRIDKGGKAVLLAENMGTTNGIALSPDEGTLYVNESLQRKIWVFDVDARGNISNKRLLTEFPDFGLDGMKCDREGNLYATRHGKGTIAVLNNSGKLIREIPLEGRECSNLVFGGLNGKLVFVTMQDRKGVEKFRNDIAGKGW